MTFVDADVERLRGDTAFARVAAADLVVVGPAPPHRGGVAAHTARLVEAAAGEGVDAAALSFRRLYPSVAFPGRSQVHGHAPAPWAAPVLDVLAPSTWGRAGALLRAARGVVAVQWWHPAFAPLLLAATRRVDSRRLVAVCHNALPHESFPAARFAARALLGRCGAIVVHGSAEAERVADLAPSVRGRVRMVPLPAVLPVPARSRSEAAAWLRRQAGCDGPVVVVAGHARPYKSLASTLRCWSLARRPSSARLVVVGEWYLQGAARREAAALAQRDPSIVLWERYVDDEDFVSCIAGADAVVAAFGRATQSGVVAQAVTLEVPCIVSDAGSLAAQVQAGPAAAGARVVAAGDGDALRAAFEEVLATHPDRPGPGLEAGGDDDGWAGAKRRFSDDWRRVVEAIVPPGRR